MLENDVTGQCLLGLYPYPYRKQSHFHSKQLPGCYACPECVGRRCLPCCPLGPPVALGTGHPHSPRRAPRSQHQPPEVDQGAEQAWLGETEHEQARALGRSLCWAPHLSATLAFLLSLPQFPVSSPSVGVAEQALLRTCVPPAATQDTRGQSSARVLCCSPRSHTVSW